MKRLVLADPDRAFMAHGACRGADPALFFPGRGESTAEARAICDGCPVSGPCLEYATERNIRDGMWGGTSGRDRRRMGRQAVPA